MQQACLCKRAQIHKPQNQDTQIEGLQALLTEPLHNFMHAHMQVHCTQTNTTAQRQNTAHAACLRPPHPATQPPLSCYKVGIDIQVAVATAVSRWRARLQSFDLSPSSPALFNSLLFSPPSRPYSNSKCQNVQISQGTSCLRLLGLYLKNKPRSQHFILHRSLIFIGSVEQQPWAMAAKKYWITPILTFRKTHCHLPMSLWSHCWIWCRGVLGINWCKSPSFSWSVCAGRSATHWPQSSSPGWLGFLPPA